LYAEAIARGHAFSDANKRTALVSALAYLLLQGYLVKRTAALEDVMVDVAEVDLANIFSTLAVPSILDPNPQAK
jgi:death-on-curing protein